MRGLGGWLQQLAAPSWARDAQEKFPYPGVWSDWDTLLSDAETLGYIGAEQAMGLPGVGRGVRLVADVIGSLAPNDIRYWDDPARPIEVLPRPQVLADPDPLWHGRATWTASAARDLQLCGNTFADKTRDTDRLGYPTSLPLIAPDRVSWEQSRTGPGGVYAISNDSGGRRRELEPPEMWHAAVDVPSGKRMGVGILATYQDTLRLIAAVERATFVVMPNSKPVGVLSMDTDMTPEELLVSKDAFIGGVRRDGIAALIKAQFEQIGWNTHWPWSRRGSSTCGWRRT